MKISLALLSLLLAVALLAGCVQSPPASSPTPAPTVRATVTPAASVPLTVHAQASATQNELAALLNDSEFAALNVSQLG